MPQRIQRKRTKGWRMPPNTIYVGRNGHGRGKWGNPYYVGLFRDYSAADALADFKKWMAGGLAGRVWVGPPPTTEDIRKELRGKNLACWCALDQPCHADVLIEIANQ